MNNQFDSELFRRIKLCPNCSSSKIQSEIFPYPGSLDCGIDLCNECNLAFTNPQINPNRVHELYIGPTDGIRCVDSSISLALRNIKLKFHWSRIIRLFNLPKKLKVLDYGCGDGVLTTILRKKYGTALGVDYTISSSQSKSPFLFKNYEEFTSDHHYRNYFDIIILRHVLEHTTNPNQFLQDLSVFLSKNGKFIIEVPNFDSPLRKFFGVNYNHLSVPYHQYHFSKKSIKNVLSTFEIIKIVNANVPVLIQSIFNVFDIKISDLGIFTAAGYPLQLLLNIFFADSTAMIVLVKPQKAFDLPN